MHSKRDIVEQLICDIRDGKYPSGGKFPSLTRLTARFKVSRPTAMMAVEALKVRGYLVAQPGSGTFVTNRARLLGGSVGFVVPGMRYAEVFPPICQKLAQLAQKRGLNLIVGGIYSDDPDERAEQALEFARQLVRERVVGVFFQPIEFVCDSSKINRRILDLFDDAKIPVVLIDEDIVPSPKRSGYDLVGIDNFNAGRMVAQHLVMRGARRIVFLKRPDCGFSVQDRYDGARSAVLSFSGKASANKVCICEKNIDLDDRSAVRRLFVPRSKFDAAICRNDHRAAHLIAALRKLGKRVPEDLKVVGFNDVDYASIMNPSLTTVHFPCEEVARTMFRVLLERMENPSMPAHTCYLLSPLIVRQST